MEVWKPVSDSSGAFEISNLGRVRSYLRRRINKIHNTPVIIDARIGVRGYRLWSGSGSGIRRTTYRVHVEVAKAFIGPRPPGMQINHIDGVKSNNCVENLEYVTASENVIHALKIGLRHGLVGEKNPCATLTEDDVRQIKSALSFGVSQKKIAEAFGTSRSNVSLIKRGIKWKHVQLGVAP